jgi:heme exporter protein C
VNAPASTASTATRALGTISLIGLATLLVFAFVLTPAEATQGDAFRLLYIHVPSPTIAYLACMVTTIGSVMVLWKGSEWWDTAALASARIAAVFTAMTLIGGSIWGRATWGVFWVWDARLTSTAMLLVLLLGYLALRRLSGDADAQSKRAAVLGVLLIPNVILIHYSVDWWRSVHQEPTLLRADPEIDGIMLFTWFLGVAVFLAIYAWLMIHGFRVAWLERQVESIGLEAAIAERRAEQVAPAPGGAG